MAPKPTPVTATIPEMDHFDYWWQQQGCWVEPPNERRNGESGVLRTDNPSGQPLYIKRQTGHLYRSPLHPLGRPTVIREARVLRALQKLGVQVPDIVFSGCRKVAGKWQALLVTRELNGFQSLPEWYAKHQDEELHQRMLHQLATTLVRLHRHGWQHGCLYAKHVFVRLRGSAIDIALLDLEKGRRRIRAAAASRHDLQQLERHRDPMPSLHWRSLTHYYHRAAFRTSASAHPRMFPQSAP